jgi:hypothetical protein
MKRVTRNTLFASLAAVVLTVTSVTPAAAQYFFFDRVDRVLGHDIDTWTIPVPAGPSEVVVRGSRNTDLDCYVYDSFGRRLGKDDDETSLCIVDINPSFRGNIRVHIANLGTWTNEYRITVE